MNVFTNDVVALRSMPVKWEGQVYNISYEEFGEGPPLLFLPAFSTICTRAEMRPLARLLSDRYRCTLVDWPGFGDSDRPPLNYRPSLYLRCLEEVVTHLFDTPPPVIAAGHACSYVLRLGAKETIEWPSVVLIAPTWRGPLPTVMGERPVLFHLIEELVRLPVLGTILYRLNTSKPVIRRTAEDHVFADPSTVTHSWLEEKHALTLHPNARYAAAAFLTGGLDLYRQRDIFLFDLREMPAPVLLLVGEQTPERSREEMHAVMELPNVDYEILPGSLGLHEEVPDAIARHVSRFLLATA